MFGPSFHVSFTPSYVQKSFLVGRHDIKNMHIRLGTYGTKDTCDTLSTSDTKSTQITLSTYGIKETCNTLSTYDTNSTYITFGTYDTKKHAHNIGHKEYV